MTEAARKLTSTYAYWDSKRGPWPNITKVALWWGDREHKTSLIALAAEHTLAILRKVDLPGRARMKDITVQREMFLRCNKDFLEGVLQRRADKL